MSLTSPPSASPLRVRPRLRLLRQHVGDTRLALRLNAQYGSMLRTSLSVHGRLMRLQALRQKREKIDGVATGDAWAQHVPERSMLEVIDLEYKQALGAASPKRAPDEESPKVAPVEPPAASATEGIEDSVSETGTNS